MAHDDYGARPMGADYRVLNGPIRYRVLSAGNFIQEENLWIVHQRAR